MNWMDVCETSNRSWERAELSRNSLFDITSCANSWSVARPENVGKRSDIKSRLCRRGVNSQFITMWWLDGYRSGMGRLEILLLVYTLLGSLGGESFSDGSSVLMQWSCPLCWCWTISHNGLAVAISLTLVHFKEMLVHVAGMMLVFFRCCLCTCCPRIKHSVVFYSDSWEDSLFECVWCVISRSAWFCISGSSYRVLRYGQTNNQSKC